MSEQPQRTLLSRRRFLTVAAAGGSAALLAACAAGSQPAPAATAIPPTPEPDPTATPAPAAAPAAAEDEVTVMVSDVLEYVLESDDWEGDYGQVRFALHEAVHDGDSVYYIRTDASDPAFAEEEGLVFVPLLNAAAGMEDVNHLFAFADGRPPVLRYAPGEEKFSSLFRVVDVDLGDSGLEPLSAGEIDAAVGEGAITAEERNLFVNYPLVKWADGELTVDSELKEVLTGGQLFEPVDTENMTVTMKLHQCYPGSRYILTDTGSEPMAPMMNIPAAGPTQQLMELGATDEIWVFGNGIPGPGVMGFQPAIFDNKAGQPAWSPFWNHFTVTWTEGAEVRLLTNSMEIRELVDSGELEQWNGVPDSHPNGFVVNCPAPILAPNTFSA